MSTTSTSAIEVRIRHEDTDRAVPLCTWDLHALDTLIPLIERWGLYLRVGGLDTMDGFTMSGQFVLDDSSAYFEIIVHDPEPSR